MFKPQYVDYESSNTATGLRQNILLLRLLPTGYQRGLEETAFVVCNEFLVCICQKYSMQYLYSGGFSWYISTDVF